MKSPPYGIFPNINNIGLRRIWAETTQDNERAIKVLEHLNFFKIADLEDNGIEYEFISRRYDG
jgi:RimJ/RimL family protein N-acetyltransferase